MTPQDQSNLEVREARQRAQRHQACKDAALWFAAACVLLWAIKFIVERGV